MSFSQRSNVSKCFALAGLLLVLAAVFLAVSPTATSRADSVRADWEHDWVALTVAQNGAWGTAVNGNLTRAMMQAIRECSRKSGAIGNDCGAEITTVRAAWSLAYACGDYTFIANGDTPADARLAAILRAVDLKEIIGQELPQCMLVVAVGSDGRVEPPDSRREILSLPLRN